MHAWSAESVGRKNAEAASDERAARRRHQDFSEDTYRTLAAADNAVMLVDGAKGLEPQTRKLFEVVRMRRAPRQPGGKPACKPILLGEPARSHVLCVAVCQSACVPATAHSAWAPAILDVGFRNAAGVPHFTLGAGSTVLLMRAMHVDGLARGGSGAPLASSSARMPRPRPPRAPRRQLPIFTFVNKLDRPALEPLEIMDQLEREFGLRSYPVNWPIGSGDRRAAQTSCELSSITL